MIQKNKVSNYLLYAIGEIMLVVVGILIAVGINNWNDKTYQNQRKNLLLNALKLEFESNLAQLKQVIYHDELITESSMRLLKLKREEVDLIPTDTLRSLLQNSSYLWTFDSQSGALRSGISSGDIHLIANDTLVNLLFSWPDIVRDANENEHRSINKRINGDYVIDKHVPKINYRSFEHPELGSSEHPADYKGLISDLAFETYISERYSHTYDALAELNQVMDQNILILKLINKELNQE